MKIRWRLALFGAAVTTVALIVFSILLNALVGSAVGDEQNRTLSEVVDSAVVSLESDPVSP